MTEVTKDLVVAINPTVQWRKYLKGIVIDPGLALNETAAEFFSCFDGKRSLSSISMEIAETFGVSEQQCFDDLKALVEDLLGEEIVVGIGESASVV